MLSLTCVFHGRELVGLRKEGVQGAKGIGLGRMDEIA